MLAPFTGAGNVHRSLGKSGRPATCGVTIANKAAPCRAARPRANSRRTSADGALSSCSNTERIVRTGGGRDVDIGAPARERQRDIHLDGQRLDARQASGGRFGCRFFGVAVAMAGQRNDAVADLDTHMRRVDGRLPLELGKHVVLRLDIGFHTGLSSRLRRLELARLAPVPL